MFVWKSNTVSLNTVCPMVRIIETNFILMDRFSYRPSGMIWELDAHTKPLPEPSIFMSMDNRHHNAKAQLQII